MQEGGGSKIMEGYNEIAEPISCWLFTLAYVYAFSSATGWLRT